MPDEPVVVVDESPLPPKPGGNGAPTPTPEKRQYKYQPTYPEGHELAGQPMGGEQVIEYDPAVENDLAGKLVANNNRMQAEMRRLKSQSGVEVQNNEEPLPAGAMSRKAELFKRRDFTSEERLEFAKGLSDPSKVQETFDRMSAARVGSNEDFKGLTARQIQQAESQAGMRFGREHPEITSQPNDTPYTNPYGYKATIPRDAALLLSWCDKRDLYHTYENLVLAWERLKKAGLLSEAPIAAREMVPELPAPADDEEGADSPPPVTQPARRPVSTSSAMTQRNSAAPPRAPSRGEPTWRDIESLSADQLKAKPAEWKKQAYLLFRKLPNIELNKKLEQRGMGQKLEALAG